MAYAVFLVEAGFFSALFTTDIYSNIAQKVSNPQPIAIALVLFIWGLLHVFMRWQLRNRRIAAIQVSTIISALLDDLNEIKRTETVGEVTEAGKLKKFFDYFIPIASSTVQSDVRLKSFPAWYRDRFLVVQNSGTGATFGELFPTIGSFLMLIGAMAYVNQLGC